MGVAKTLMDSTKERKTHQREIIHAYCVTKSTMCKLQRSSAIKPVTQVVNPSEYYIGQGVAYYWMSHLLFMSLAEKRQMTIDFRTMTYCFARPPFLVDENDLTNEYFIQSRGTKNTRMIASLFFHNFESIIWNDDHQVSHLS
jgi:hypothetical protein